MRGKEIVEPLIKRLTDTNPIRVDWVDLAKVPGLKDLPGRLGMTFLPGKQGDGTAGRHPRDLDTDAIELHEKGVDELFLLVEDHELKAMKVPDIAAVLGRRNVEVVGFPIVDMDVPADRTKFRAALDVVLDRIAAGDSVVVACRGGLGRTGTAVGCLLRDGGLDGAAAIELTRAMRQRTIENSDQENFIKGWNWPDRVPGARSTAL